MSLTLWKEIYEVSKEISLSNNWEPITPEDISIYMNNKFWKKWIEGHSKDITNWISDILNYSETIRNNLKTDNLLDKEQQYIEFFIRNLNIFFAYYDNLSEIPHLFISTAVWELTASLEKIRKIGDASWY